MAPRKKKEENGPIVDQVVRLATEKLINDFMKDTEKTELSFPQKFDNNQRRYVHEYVKKFGLKSKSHGKGTNRILTVYKQTKNVEFDEEIELECSIESQKHIFQFLKRYPLSPKEKSDLTKPLKADLTKQKPFPFRISVGQMNTPYLVVPPYPTNLSEQVIKQRVSLPIFHFRSEIIETVRNSRAVVISGETGSGKTTQVPQYLLEDATQNQIPYRIICTQPRRLSAISTSERVAQERNEILGQTVGYQIRLESKISPSSNLIYCTNGILLRCLMSDKHEIVFKHITHVIVDEVHERDKFSDFLLISLKRAMRVVPHLKVILMSATIDAEIFTKYFFDCPLIEIPGKMFEVQLNYLEDILVEVKYTNSRIEQMKRSNDFGDVNGEMTKNEPDPSTKLLSAIENVHLDDETRDFADEVLLGIMNDDDDTLHDQFLYLVEAEDLDIDYIHSQFGFSALMIATKRGLTDFMVALLEAGASPEHRNRAGESTLDLAHAKNDEKLIKILEKYVKDGNFVPKINKNQVLEERKLATMLLEGYLAENMEDTIDHALLFRLISQIHKTKPEGCILVFLPGYADILEQAEKIQSELNPNEYRLFMLHSNMQTGDQRGVFNRMPAGVRKIVLATNLAETSITIDDVVYVIDTGRVKQQTFDAISGSSQLAVCWCSKACVKQRAGRAGRCQAGVCYRMYSQSRFESLEAFTLPELLRVPLTEICIQAKLIEKELTIGEFLEEAIQPPSSFNVKQSIQILKAIGALDDDEHLTDLGLRLGDLPIDVRLGKMLLYGVMLRCLDPILTIVSALSTSDPFIFPAQSFERGKVMGIKRNLSEDSFSDHLILLRAFQKWSREKTTRTEKRFCQQNYLRFGTMDMIAGVRSQILGHLRSIGFVRSSGPGNIRDLNQYSANWGMVKACIVAGLYPNVAHIDRKKGVMRSRNVTKMGIHMSSVVKQKSADKRDSFEKLPTDWIVYEEKIRVSRFCLSHINTVVTPLSVVLFAGSLSIDENTQLMECDDDSEGNELSAHQILIDDWLQFTCESSLAIIIFEFKQKLSAQFLNFLACSRDYYKKPANTAVLNVLNDVLAQEETSYHLPKLRDINEKPRALHISYDLTKVHPEMAQINSRSQITPTKSQISRNFQQNTPPNKPRMKVMPSTSSHPPPISHRYFIVKAASHEQVLACIQTNRWDFSTSIRAQLVRIARQNPESKIFILFSVPLNKYMCCFSEFYLHENYQIAFRLIDERKFTFTYLRNSLNGSGMPPYEYVKHLDEFLDGEEFPSKLGDFYYNLLVN